MRERKGGGKGCYPIGKPAVGPSLVVTEGLVIGCFGVCFYFIFYKYISGCW